MVGHLWTAEDQVPEDIVGAAKFLLCRADAVALYERDLMTSFAAFHFILGADMVTHLALVLTPRPRLAEVYRHAHDPEKARPDLIRGGNRFSEKPALGLDPGDHAPQEPRAG